MEILRCLTSPVCYKSREWHVKCGGNSNCSPSSQWCMKTTNIPSPPLWHNNRCHCHQPSNSLFSWRASHYRNVNSLFFEGSQYGANVLSHWQSIWRCALCWHFSLSPAVILIVCLILTLPPGRTNLMLMLVTVQLLEVHLSAFKILNVDNKGCK